MQEYLVYVIAGVAVAVLVAAGALLARFLWARAVRTRVVSLVGRREAIAAGERQLRAVVSHLAEATDDELIAFAISADHEERHSLSDVSSRLHHQAEDLMALALPKSLWGAADALADAAWRVAREAERAANGKTPDEVLAGLGEVDLGAIRRAVEDADAAVDELRDQYGVEEAVVYGGGLYI